MLSIFEKKTGKYPIESKWSIHKGQKDGKPIFIRRNDSAKGLSINTDYIYRVGIAIPLLKPNEMGLPSKEELVLLTKIEDELCKQLEKDQMAIMVLVITTGGMREFVFYTRSPEMIKPILDKLRKKYSSHEIQSYIEDDKRWSVYKQIT